MKVGALIDMLAAIEVSFIDLIVKPLGRLTAWRITCCDLLLVSGGLIEVECGEGKVAPAGNGSYRGFYAIKK
jgi:hypothetical protein